MIPPKEPFETTVCTERGTRFIVELYEGRRRAVFVDPARGYARVAVARFGKDVTEDYKRLEGAIRGVALYVLKQYAAQHPTAEAVRPGIELLPGIKLSQAEIKEGVGAPRPSRYLAKKAADAAPKKGPRR